MHFINLNYHLHLYFMIITVLLQLLGMTVNIKLRYATSLMHKFC